MESKEITYYVKVKASYTDSFGYTSIVFENLKYTDPDYQFIMAVMFPNWEQQHFNIDDIGYVTVRYVEAGIDKWFDGQQFNTYRYTNVIFLKFVHETKTIELNEITVD